MNSSPSVLTLLAAAWMLAGALMAALWVWHLRIRNAGIVDVGWAASLALLGLLYALVGTGFGPRRWLIGGMLAVWGSRLALYLLRDRIVGKPEDGRYAELRRSWRTYLPARFFVFFQAQALLAALLSFPAAVAAVNPSPRLAWLEWLAAGLWLVALAGESAADRQLERFKARPSSRGAVCQDGLWRYSRHPNYFFEWLVWVAYALFALASPGGWPAVLCPALMLYLLFRVTGIPATEAQAIRSRGDAYRRYQQSTSVFVPWTPRSL